MVVSFRMIIVYIPNITYVLSLFFSAFTKIAQLRTNMQRTKGISKLHGYGYGIRYDTGTSTEIHHVFKNICEPQWISDTKYDTDTGIGTMWVQINGQNGVFVQPRGIGSYMLLACNSNIGE